MCSFLYLDFPISIKIVLIITKLVGGNRDCKKSEELF